MPSGRLPRAPSPHPSHLPPDTFHQRKGCELAIDDGGELFFFFPVGFDFRELELEQALLDRVVGRDLEGDGAGPLEIAEPSSLLDDDAREVFRASCFFDEPRRGPDTFFGGTCVMVIGEQSPRDVFPLFTFEV